MTASPHECGRGNSALGGRGNRADERRPPSALHFELCSEPKIAPNDQLSGKPTNGIGELDSAFIGLRGWARAWASTGHRADAKKTGDSSPTALAMGIPIFHKPQKQRQRNKFKGRGHVQRLRRHLGSAPAAI
jgi:hypothetical protein